MSAAAATIERMAKKKGRRSAAPPPDATPAQGEQSAKTPPKRSPAYTVFARISPELGAAFEAYIASLRPRPTATSVLHVFIEEGLKAAGFWPLDEKKQGE